ncbi:MAG TPA: hypothetical protein VEO54_18440 [Thermoanaerobaculia bacterium]|nr:hypothetical protein [Thermoanaerobaculia bacterium]
MIRSILPSRHRQTARLLKAIRKRAHRRVIREAVHRDAELEELLRDVKVGDIVDQRRGGDKLNHFIRWCEKKTAGMARTEALAAVRALLPGTLIGDHAYFHWEIHLDYHRREAVPFRERQRREAQSEHDSAVFRLHRALRVDPSLHGRLNAEIKANLKENERPRLLHGIHDVEAFVREVCRCGRKRMLRLIAEVEGRPQGRPSYVDRWRPAGCLRRRPACALRGWRRDAATDSRRGRRRSAYRGWRSRLEARA